jgi:hypothetical protein
MARSASILPPDSEAQQRRIWRIERAMWLLWLVVIVAGVSGALGYGPLVHTSQGNEMLTIEYDRLVRADAPGEIRLRIRDVSSPAVSVRISQSYLDKVDITSHLPAPQRVSLADQALVLEFPVVESAGQVELLLRVQPGGYGPVNGAIAVGSGAPVTIRQFVLP